MLDTEKSRKNDLPFVGAPQTVFGAGCHRLRRLRARAPHRIWRLSRNSGERRSQVESSRKSPPNPAFPASRRRRYRYVVIVDVVDLSVVGYTTSRVASLPPTTPFLPLPRLLSFSIGFFPFTHTINSYFTSPSPLLHCHSHHQLLSSPPRHPPSPRSPLPFLLSFLLSYISLLHLDPHRLRSLLSPSSFPSSFLRLSPPQGPTK